MSISDMDVQISLVFIGFDLAKFDEWREALPDGGAKASLKTLRDDAVELVRQHRIDEARPTLEVLHFAWQTDHTLAVLQPRARAELRRVYAKKNKKAERLGWIKRQLQRQPHLTADDLHHALPEELRCSITYLAKQVSEARK
ncbi:hypothetical protein [Pseudohaliea sp.]|uniref:hypothetical protein n=1 Tax=Pseudohaliea sp. TaxID=2740289 RepID=UPI0032EC82B2